jgi:hypothetical protein
MQWIQRALVALILAVCLIIQPLQAAPLDTAADQETPIAPMSDPAMMGAACLGLAVTTVTTAYIISPNKAMLFITGAHIATNAATLFISMFGILGGASCAVAAAATPGMRWLFNQSDAIADHLETWLISWHGDPPRTVTTFIRPMNESEHQSMGCVVGGLSSLSAAMIASPVEVAMLSIGTNAMVTSTPLLGLGLLTTVIAAGCGIGSFVSVPIMRLIDDEGDN